MCLTNSLERDCFEKYKIFRASPYHLQTQLPHRTTRDFFDIPEKIVYLELASNTR